MQTDVRPSIVRMEPEVLKSLLTEVKETVATNFDLVQNERSFTSINMWKIRKNVRMTSIRWK